MVSKWSTICIKQDMTSNFWMLNVSVVKWIDKRSGVQFSKKHWKRDFKVIPKFLNVVSQQFKDVWNRDFELKMNFWKDGTSEKLQVKSNFGNMIWESFHSTQNDQYSSVYQISLQKFPPITSFSTLKWKLSSKIISTPSWNQWFQTTPNLLSMTNVYMQSNSHIWNFAKIFSPRMASSWNLKEGPNFCFSNFDWMIEIGTLMVYIFFIYSSFLTSWKCSKFEIQKFYFPIFSKFVSLNSHQNLWMRTLMS